MLSSWAAAHRQACTSCLQQVREGTRWRQSEEERLMDIRIIDTLKIMVISTSTVGRFPAYVKSDENKI